MICASPNYIAAHGAPSTPDDLAQHRVISFQSVSVAELMGLRIRRHRNHRVVSLPSQREHDRRGDRRGDLRSRAGAAVSYQIADHVRAGRLSVVLEAFEPPPRPVHLVYDAQNRLPLKRIISAPLAFPKNQRIIACLSFELQQLPAPACSSASRPPRPHRSTRPDRKRSGPRLRRADLLSAPQ